MGIYGRSGTPGGAAPPMAHASTHENGGADEVDVTGLSGLLADEQTPLTHGPEHLPGATDDPGWATGLLVHVDESRDPTADGYTPTGSAEWPYDNLSTALTAIGSPSLFTTVWCHGSFTLSSQYTMVDKLKLKGDGSEITVISSTTSDLIKIPNNVNCEIDDIKLVTTGAYKTLEIDAYASATACRIDRVTLENNGPGHTIYMKDCLNSSGIKFDRVATTNSGLIYIENSNNIQLWRCAFLSSHATGTVYMLNCATPGSLQIYDSQIVNFSGPALLLSNSGASGYGNAFASVGSDAVDINDGAGASSFSDAYSSYTTYAGAGLYDISIEAGSSMTEMSCSYRNAKVQATGTFTHTEPRRIDELSVGTDVTTLNATTTEHGLLPKLDNVATNFLNGQGAWSVPGGGGFVVGPASATDHAFCRFDLATGKLIQDSAVTCDDSGNIATAGTVDGVDISAHAADADAHHAMQHAMDSATQHTVTDVTTLNATTSAHGFLPKLDNDATHYMDGQGAWTVPGGGTYVVGPASATDHAIARYDLTTGKLLQDSSVTVDDSGNMALGSGNITTSGTVDGRDVSTDGSTLDTHVSDTTNPHTVTEQQTYTAGHATVLATADPAVYQRDETVAAPTTGFKFLNANTAANPGELCAAPYLEFEGSHQTDAGAHDVNWRVQMAGVFGESALAFAGKSIGAGSYTNWWGFTETGKLASIADFQYHDAPQLGLISSTLTAATAVEQVEQPPLCAWFGSAWNGAASQNGFTAMGCRPIPGSGSIDMAQFQVATPDGGSTIHYLWEGSTGEHDEYSGVSGPHFAAYTNLVQYDETTGASLARNRAYEEVTITNNLTVDSTIQAPAGSVLVACNAKVKTAISGAATVFKVGIVGDDDCFNGQTIGVAKNSTAKGMCDAHIKVSAATAVRMTFDGLPDGVTGDVALQLWWEDTTPPDDFA